MDRIVKLLIAQIGFTLLGVIIVAIPCYFLMERDLAKIYMVISGLFLGSIFLIWHILSKKYVRLDSQTWSFYSVKVILLTVILNVVFFFYANGLDGLVNFLGYEDLNENLNIQRNLTLNPYGLLVLILVSPIAEALLFQGAILSFLLESKMLATKYSILISALIFAILHPGQNLSFFFFGLLWGYLYYRSGSLGLCILSNMIVTGISALLMIYYPDARSLYDLTGAIPFAGLAVLSVLLSAICIYYLNRSMKVPSWQIPGNGDSESDSIVIS